MTTVSDHTEQQPDTPPAGPYATAAPLYWHAGWRGCLPLPPRAKKPVPEGYTGANGTWPSFADVHAWTEDRGNGNLALRLPPHVIGIDVDGYDGKGGGNTLQALIAQHGPLPPTWRSTSRDDGTSGIALYRVPEGLAWPGAAGPGIELIQHRHRYAVAWPSIHPDTGRTYRWINPAGHDVIGTVPNVDDLPDLPDTWVQGLTRGELASDTPRVDLPDVAVRAWLDHRAGTEGDPACRAVRAALARYLDDLAQGSKARHDVAMYATSRLCHLAAEGHTGVATALREFKTAWTHRTADRAEDLPSEWARLLVGAVRIAAADPQGKADPCDNPFHGLIASPPARPQEQPCPTPSPSSPSPTSASPAPSNASPTASSDSSSAPTDPTSSTTDPAERERTSWWPRDIDAVLTGADEEPPPAYLVRDDGQALLYAGKTNGIIGESESGKTWVALHALHQALDNGDNVTIVDFEDTPAGLITRLRDIGVTDTQLRNQIAYVGPDEALDVTASGDLYEHLGDHAPSLIVLDGVNAAMTLLGLDLNSNTDATAFAQRLLRPLAATGACVVYVDHIPKSRDNETKGGIGAQAKRAMTTGCTLKAEMLKPFGRGETGRIKLTVDKDRAGHVRGASGGSRHAGTAVLTSDRVSGHVTITVEAPDTRPAEQREPFRPTHLMERVSAFLATCPDGATGRAVRGEVSGNVKAILAALDRLAAEGYVTRASGPNRSILYRHVKPYREIDDLVSPGGSPSGSGGSPVVPGGSAEPPPSGGKVGGSVVPGGSRPPYEVGVGTGTTDRPRDPQDHASRPGNDAGGSGVHCKACGAEVDQVYVDIGQTECPHCRKAYR